MIVHREDETCHAVAACEQRGDRIGIEARGVQQTSVPQILVTSYDVLRRAGDWHRQVHRDNTVAAMNGLIRPLIVACSVVRAVIPYVFSLTVVVHIVSASIETDVVRTVDTEHERYHAVAAVSAGKYLRVAAGLGEGLTLALGVLPCVAVTSVHVDGGRLTLVDLDIIEYRRVASECR